MVTSIMIFVSEAVCSSRLFTALVGLAETNSEHPLGAAVVKYAKSVSLVQCDVFVDPFTLACF